jgi:class 3 adenylate cyclase
MQTLSQALVPHRRSLRRVALIGIFVAAAMLLLWLRQPVGAALIPLIGLLLAKIERRNQYAHALAQQLAAGQLAEKLEVSSGGWGELSRAVNGLLQEQRVQQRLRLALPAPLPQEAMRALLGGTLPTSGKPRMTAVLLVSYAYQALEQAERAETTASLAWQALACAAQQEAQHHSALLHPCGDAIMLAFGAFEDQSAGQSLRSALATADTLLRSWCRDGFNVGGPLILSLASGPALALALPGLGYCVVGAPVEQAVQLQNLAHRAGRQGLVCSEGVYYALRNSGSAGWQPTELRIPIPNRSPQIVYGRIEREVNAP